MKLSLTVLSAIMAGAMLLNGVPAMAETSSVPVTIQEMNLREIKVAFDRLKQTQRETREFRNALAAAEKSRGSYTLRLEKSESAYTIGTLVALGGSSAIYGMRVTPLRTFSQVAQKPTLVGVVIGGVLAVGGYYFADEATGKLVIAEADIKNAQSNIDQLSSIMAEDAAFIKSRSANLGATVNNNIVSYEGMPEALKVFGGQSLNLNSN